MAKTQTRPAPREAQPKRKPGRKKPPPPWYAKYVWLPWVVGLAAFAIVLFALRSDEPDAPAPGVAR